MAIADKLQTVASGVTDIRTALKEIDSNFGAGHISTLDDEIRQIGSNGTLVFYKDSEGNYKTKLFTNVNSIKSSISGDIIAIILPENVHEIGRDRLSSLTSLEFINLHNVTYFNALSFSSNTITIDASKDLRNVEWIAGSAFSNCTGLTGELYLPKLKGFAYKNDTLTSESNQFNGCSGLTKVMDLGSVSSINNSTFKSCVNLTEVHFPETLNIISGNTAFQHDTKLNKIYFKSLESALNVNYVNDTRHPFYSTTVTPREVYINDQLLTNLVIPNTVTSIKACAFYKNTALTSVTIPSSVTYIGNYAFNGCTSITSIVIPSTVTIDNKVFENCTNLQDVTIQGSVNIGSNVFDGKTFGGTLTVNGNVEPINKTALSNHYELGKFKYVYIHGNLTSVSNYELINSPIEEFVVDGNIIHTIGSGSIINNRSNNNSLKFAELGGTIDSKIIYDNLDANSNCIFHLKYNGIAGTPEQCNANFANVKKIYVGDGSSQAADQAVLNQYLSDSSWATYSSKLDLWYNYTGEYKN